MLEYLNAVGVEFELTTLTPRPISTSHTPIIISGDYLYAVGGMLDDLSCSNEVHRYRLSTNKWELFATLDTPVRSSALAIYNNKLIIHSGFNQGTTNIVVNKTFTIDLTSKAVTTQTYSAIPSRAEASYFQITNKLYMFGGVNKNDYGYINLDTYAWVNLGITVTHSRQAGFCLNGDEFFIVGGISHNTSAEVNTCFKYQVSTDQQTQLPPLPLLAKSTYPIKTRNGLKYISTHDGASYVNPITLNRLILNNWVTSNIDFPRLVSGYSTVHGNVLYIYGGFDGSKRRADLIKMKFNW